MSWWSDRSIEWFSRASGKSSFHRDLAALVKKHIDPSDTVLEAGCGLGYLAQELSASGCRITALDKDPRVIEAAAGRSGLNIFRCADLYGTEEKADVLVCVNFGHIGSADDIRRLGRHAGKKIIYVMSRHTNRDNVSRQDRTEKVKSILEETGLSYSMTDFSLDFDQPLLSMEEAADFIAWTYPDDDVQRFLGFVEPSGDREYPFRLGNRKNMVLFDIGI